MASDLFGHDSPRNFARGSAPPYHSWEWCGVAKPPGLPGMAGIEEAPAKPSKPSKLLNAAKVVGLVGLGYLIVTAEER